MSAFDSDEDFIRFIEERMSTIYQYWVDDSGTIEQDILKEFRGGCKWVRMNDGIENEIDSDVYEGGPTIINSRLFFPGARKTFYYINKAGQRASAVAGRVQDIEDFKELLYTMEE